MPDLNKSDNNLHILNILNICLGTELFTAAAMQNMKKKSHVCEMIFSYRKVWICSLLLKKPWCP